MMAHDDRHRGAPPQAVVGWVHRPLPQGIELQVQTAPSAFALGNHEIVTTRLVLTDNQALLLARFLLRVTGHSAADVSEAPRSRWSRWSRWFRRRPRTGPAGRGRRD